ncbi:MAG: DNA polymerase II large subunit [Candidatus Micrarchaeota archaeon]|nr:DNA polymerase II large subunit [Candidatus Micrarchaeota archaeon]
MDINEYFGLMSSGYDSANAVAIAARAKGFDQQSFVEIKAAPDVASRVEGILNVEGLAEKIKANAAGKSRQTLAFDMVKEICNWDRMKGKTKEEILTLAIRVGLSILTEGVVVASTEGIQRTEMHRNADGSDYAAVLFAGPIRGAGGTSAAMTVAMADYGRKILGIGSYRATQSEVERCLEEIQIYDSRAARLQYMPSEDDIRHIIKNCEVCVDGVPTEQIEVSVNRNLKRLDKDGKEEAVTNKIRGGIGLVVCEGIAQKAKSVLKHTKNAGLDWSWLNGVIKADKPSSGTSETQEKSNTAFLKDLVAGRPILAYPAMSGSFRLRYGRSRYTGIAAKGFNPATMIILDEFIAVGTQLRIEKPGKGCVAAPVDSIEGPFVKLEDGTAFRVNSAEKAKDIKGRVAKIIAVGDILVTYGDFKKSNTPLQQPGYVEEYWAEQLRAAGCGEIPPNPSFSEAFGISKRYGVPMHPLYTYDFADASAEELGELRSRLSGGSIEPGSEILFEVKGVTIAKSVAGRDITPVMERLCLPHRETGENIVIDGADAQSIIASLGLAEGEKLALGTTAKGSDSVSGLDFANANSQFRIMRRSTRIGARIGRPEKAKERLMKPAPNVLFPVGESGGKERNVAKAYEIAKKKFRNSGIEVEVGRYRCAKGGELVYLPYCQKHGCPARIEYVCKSCGSKSISDACPNCGSKTSPSDIRNLDIIGELDSASSRLGIPIPKSLKGVRGLSSSRKSAEPLEKGLLRASLGVHIFKDGTSRFDAMNMPITHFYPREVGVGFEKLKGMGYTKDYKGRELVSDDQLLELMHQDVVINRDGAAHMLKVAKFIDELLVRYYKMEPYYRASTVDDMVGQMAITLAPHTSAGVLCRIVGFTDARIGLSHPYVVSARRRNCDGDEDTLMLLLDALINFSRSYLPSSVGGTMDAPLTLTLNVNPSEVDDEVHDMEIVESYGLDFYNSAERRIPPSEAKVELVKDRLGTGKEFSGICFTHLSGPGAIGDSPKSCTYTKLNTMAEKIDAQFRLTDRLECVDRPNAAKNLIMSHFIPDLIGNMHSFSRQGFRCIACNSKYRRVPLVGKCTRCGGKIVLTISKSSIEKYLEVAITLADRYKLEPYIRQRLSLIRDEIRDVFGYTGGPESKQINLAKFI